LAINCQAFYILPLPKFFMESVIASRLPAEQEKSTQLGLVMAMFMRLELLAVISWILPF